MKEIVVNEKIVVKEPVTTGEVVALPGIKGDKGDAFTYDDFTPQQIAELQRPATEDAAVANAAAQRAEAAAESVQSAVEDAEQASQSAQKAATAAQEAVTNANTAIGKAETAINNANTAAETANTAVESVNALEERVGQAEATRVQSETQRQTEETNRASSEQQREANETERKQKFAQIESDATSLENSLNEAEAQRVSAENAREEAETQRETAEQERTTQFSEIKTEAETLITQTTEAKNAANTAATSATNAAEEANTAAGLANEAAAKANQAAENVDGRVTALEEKASQHYENLAAIESSGETNPNKIYIDGNTLIPYVYKGGSFVPFSGQDDGTLPIQRCIDLSEFGSVTGVYRFDDTGYYILTNDNFTKTDLYFKKKYTVNIFNNSTASNRGEMRDVLCKLNNKLFLATGIENKIVYMYDENTNEGKYLENPDNIIYYGGIYSFNNKVYYFHRSSGYIYVYDADGNLIINKSHNYGYIRITDGIAFTTDGYKLNLEDLTFEKLTFPNLENISNLNYVFSNGNMIIPQAIISDKDNSISYDFRSLGGVFHYGYAININNKMTIGFTSCGKYIFRYPYGIDNQVFRGVEADDIVSQGSIVRVTNYKNFVYSITKANILIIEDVSKYGTN